MRSLAFFFLFFPLSSLLSAQNSGIHSNFPAAKWEDAMLTGNGLTGAMVYGGQPEETIVFTNHKLLRPGNGRDEIPDMSDMVAPMREKMLAGEIGAGWMLYWEEWKKRSKGGMFWTQKFHPGFQMQLTQIDGSYPVKYRRSTNYETGEVITAFSDGAGDWTRETFASRDQDFVITRLRASSKGKKVFVRVKLAACERHPGNISQKSVATNGWLSWRSAYPKDKHSHAGYEGLVRVIVRGQKSRQRSDRDTLTIYNADEVLLITAIERHAKDHTMWDKEELKKHLLTIEPNYDALLAKHTAIHHPIFNRATYSLGASEADRSKSTEQLIADENADSTGVNMALLERLFTTSRYLFMSSTGKDYAPRLSGMFIGRWGAAWAGDYTLDANANMAVMGGYIANLSENMEGYHAIIKRTLPQWRAGAKKLYGMRGILGPVRIDGEVAVPHHFSDYHAHCTATGLGPWILYPLWESYLVSGDKKFLKNELYPLMVEQLHFYEDFLTFKDGNGKLIFVPSNSPENAWKGVQPRTSAAINSTMDISACRQLLTNLLQAEKDLGLPESTKARELLSQLPPYLVNDAGALQEWSWPGHGENYGHRHSSHMYVVWPGYDINLENPNTKHLVPAVEKALIKRNHSIVQAHDFIQRAIGWLRVKNGEEFYRILKYSLEHHYLYASLATSHDLNHRIYNYDYILTLQGLLIETAVFTNPGILEILPAMPAALKTGEFTGLKGRNRCDLEKVSWDLKKKTATMIVTSAIDQELEFIHRKGIKSIKANTSIQRSAHGDHARKVTLKKDQKTTITITW